MTEYIIQGIIAILAIGISAGFLARRQRLRKEGKYPYNPKGPGVRMCDDVGTDFTIPYQELDPNIYSKHSTDSEGNQRWTNGRNQLHRKDGQKYRRILINLNEMTGDLRCIATLTSSSDYTTLLA